MSIMKNMPTLDLRTIPSADALKDVEEISNIGVVILPENGDPELLNVYHAIPKKNIGHTFTLPNGVDVQQMTGNISLTATILKSKNYLIITGNTVVEEVVEECNATILATGNLIYPQRCPLNIHSHVGNAQAYDYEHYVAFDDDFELDAMTLDLMEYKTLLDIDGDLRVAKDVTIEMLKEKMPYFLVDGDVRCQKPVAAFFKLRAEIEGNLKVKGAAYEDDDE